MPFDSVSLLGESKKFKRLDRAVQLVQSADILRIPEKYKKYSYAKISQLLEAGQFCRYVGGTTGLQNKRRKVLNK